MDSSFIDFVVEQWLLFAALVLILGLLMRSWLAPRLSGVKELGTQDAIRLLNEDNTVVLDVRLDKEFKTGHILDAYNIPVGALEARVRELEKHKQDPVLVVCQTGNRSLQGAKILRKHGFEQIYSLKGGMAAWINASLPVSTKSGKSKKSGKRK